jgi:hypothetical protein
MIRTAVAVGRIAMARKDDLRPQLRRTGCGRIEITDLKPQEHAISRCDFGVADRAVMMLHIPAMQLKNESALRLEPLIVRAAMGTLTT